MVASLKKVDPVIRDAVYKPMLLSNSPRPATFKHVTKRLRLSYTLKRIAHNCLDEVKNPECRVAISFDPVPYVFAELFLKYGRTCDVTDHQGSLAAGPGPGWAGLSRSQPDAERSAIDGHSWVSVGGAPFR